MESSCITIYCSILHSPVCFASDIICHDADACPVSSNAIQSKPARRGMASLSVLWAWYRLNRRCYLSSYFSLLSTRERYGENIRVADTGWGGGPNEEENFLAKNPVVWPSALLTRDLHVQYSELFFPRISVITNLKWLLFNLSILQPILHPLGVSLEICETLGILGLGYSW